MCGDSTQVFFCFLLLGFPVRCMFLSCPDIWTVLCWSKQLSHIRIFILNLYWFIECIASTIVWWMCLTKVNIFWVSYSQLLIVLIVVFPHILQQYIFVCTYVWHCLHWDTVWMLSHTLSTLHPKISEFPYILLIYSSALNDNMNILRDSLVFHFSLFTTSTAVYPLFLKS